MSTAYYPLGMSSYNNRVNSGNYVTWKGSGSNSFPVGTTAGNIRPLTNRDPLNFYPQKFGLARPLKIYRKGTVIPHLVPNSPETLLISRNMSRAVRSSTKGTLIRQMIDNPGSFSVKENSPDETSNIELLNKNCEICNGIGVVATYKPNKKYITENPTITTTTNPLCCNEEKKARRRVVYASTNLKKNYYTTLQQYRQNRCQTYDQRAFNFLRNAEIDYAPYKPGSPYALINGNSYVANCQPNSELLESSEITLIGILFDIVKKQNLLTPTEIEEFNTKNIITFTELLSFLESIVDDVSRENALEIYYDFINNPYYGVPLSGPSNPRGCKLVVYKPSNPQFATQGAVSSSTRTLKANVDTIEKNIAGYNKDQKQGLYLGIDATALLGGQPQIPFLYKNKAPSCNPYLYTSYPQNKHSCIITDSVNIYKVGTSITDL